MVRIGIYDKTNCLIAGGVDKGNDYTLIKDLVNKRVKAIICLGKDNEKLHAAFASEVGYILTQQQHGTSRANGKQHCR